MDLKTQRPDRSDVKLRHRVEELEDRNEKLEARLEEALKRLNDLDAAMAERVGYETSWYQEQPRAAEVGYPR